MGELDLNVWLSDMPALQVPDELLRQSIERAKVDVAIRRQNEYLLYKNSASFSVTSLYVIRF